MINIFYQKTSLNDTLAIDLNKLQPNEFKENNIFSSGWNNNNLCFININHISNYIDLPNGLIYPTQEILSFIEKQTKFDLSTYITNSFKIVEIKSIKPIPNTHLNYCDVFDGIKIHQIVCGAKNVFVGLKTVMADENTRLFNGKLIENTNVMNHQSFGMLCSFKELDLLNEKVKDGIIELDSTYKVGEIFKKAYKNF